jgi:subtilisin family serine protease
MQYDLVKMGDRTAFARRTVLAAATACIAFAGTASAQSTVILGNWTTPAPTTFFVNPADTTGILGASSTYANSPGASNGVGQFRLGATLTQNAANTQSVFSVTRTGTQPFVVNAPSVVQIPVYFNGAVNLFGAPNGSGGSATFTVRVLDASNTAVFTHEETLSVSAQIRQASPVNRLTVKTLNLNAGNYTLATSFVLGGQTRISIVNPGDPGTGVIPDFFNVGFRGGVAGVGGWADNLNSSFHAVGAPIARLGFNVDGSGVKVGMIETGRPYQAGDNAVADPVNNIPLANIGAHPAFAGMNKVTLVNNAEASKQTYRREHAHAVAGIIAGDDAAGAYYGVAPGAQIVSASFASYTVTHPGNPFNQALDDLVAANATIVNISFGQSTTAGVANPFSTAVDQKVNANPNLLVVSSSGNDANFGTVGAPGTAYNGLSVGALNRDFTRRAGFSSYINTTASNLRIKPDIVAPGEQILAPSAVTGSYSRSFIGENISSPSTSQFGSISGTSFSAPHVSGVAALLHEYSDNNLLSHTKDHRVIKAVLMNSADRTVKTSGGAAWSQVTAGTLAGNNYKVGISTDQQLGAGAVDALGALVQYEPGDLDIFNDAGSIGQHDSFTPSQTERYFWDFSQADALAAGDPGTVDYLLGATFGALRATLSWDATDAGVVPNLSLRLYREGAVTNLGFSADDTLVAETLSLYSDGNGNDYFQNTGLFDFTVPMSDAVPLPLPVVGMYRPSYYLSVANLSGDAVSYGLAVDYAFTPVPEPTALAVLAFAATASLCRRRRRMACA